MPPLTTGRVARQTAPVIDDDRWPGGIRVARARWLVYRPLRLGASVISLLSVYGFALTYALIYFGRTGRLLLGGCVVAIALLAPVMGRLRRPGVLITADSQPARYDLVFQTAWQIGVAVPAKVWLTGRPHVGLRPRRRPELLIGWPLIASMPRRQLAAVIAHELALLQFGRTSLTIRLLGRWRSELPYALVSEPVPPRIASRLAELAPFASIVDTAADAAAVRVSDRITAAQALVAAEYFRGAYGAYTADTWFVARSGAATVMKDVADGWSRVLAAGHAVGVVFADLVARQHPELAATILEVPDPEPTRPANPVAVAGLRPREIRRLAAQTVATDRIRWSTFATAPRKLWLRRATDDLRRARSTVRRVLGRAPHDDAETIRVLAERPVEVSAAALSVDPAELLAATTPEELADMRSRPGWMLVEAAECLLLQRQWRLEHPALRGVLIDPEGVRHSLRDATPDQIIQLLGLDPAVDAGHRSDGPPARTGAGHERAP
jgi:hypothetical protein